jgi:hypothetical protein
MSTNKTSKKSVTPPDRLTNPTRILRLTKRIKYNYTTPLQLTHTVSPTITSYSPYTATKTLYKSFIKELNNIFTNEQIIDREDNVQFKELLAEQRPYNKLLYKLKSANIICFVVCKYYKESLIFNKYNDYKGTLVFNELLKKNNMSMTWLNYNTMYIYINT